MKCPSQIPSVTQWNINGYDTIKLYYWLGVNENLQGFFPLCHSEGLYFSPDTYIFPYYIASCTSWFGPIHKAKENNLAWLGSWLGHRAPITQSETGNCLLTGNLSLFRLHVSLTLVFSICEMAVWVTEEEGNGNKLERSHLTKYEDSGFARMLYTLSYQLDYSIWFWDHFLEPYISHLPVSSLIFMLMSLHW